MISLQAYLLLSAFLFSVGIACVLIRKNVIQILMGVELVLNAAALNFAAFSHYSPALPDLKISGQAVAIFVIVLAAAEAAVALALILSVFRVFRTVRMNAVADLRG